jgi:hypothetical protein
MNYLKALVLSLALISTANAGKSRDYYPTETYAATIMTYQMLLNGLEIIKSDPPGSDIVITHQEPAICWPFPINSTEFYRVIQDGVNARVLALPQKDRGKAGNLIGWYVWNTVQQAWGC